MSTQNLVIGFAVLVVVLGAWTTLAAKGVPWHQDSQRQQQGGAANRPGKAGGGQPRESRQTQDQQQHSEQEEGEGDPADWTEEELKVWLENVSVLCFYGVLMP